VFDDAPQPPDGPEPLTALDAEIAAAGGPWEPTDPDAIGHTMFDSPFSEDNSVTVLLPRERIKDTPSQALVRIHSKDGRSYLGAVVAGPFAEPDGLRADSPLLVTVVTRGGIFTPNYHGRVQVALLGEEQGGALVPPRFRPLPNSPVRVLDAAETAAVLGVEGDLRLGVLVGQEAVPVAIPSTRKDVLPRHTAILGTTGGGKSTTVARLVQQAQQAGYAVVLLDVEGEYTFLHEPVADPRLCAALAARQLTPAGVPQMTLYHLADRETTNPDHPDRRPFTLQFGRISPYTVMELLELSDAQGERFLQAYEIAKALLRELGIFPKRGNREEEKMALELDEFQRGYPRLQLAFLLDVVRACRDAADKRLDDFAPHDPALQKGDAPERLRRHVQGLKPSHPISWRVVLSRLQRLEQLKVFRDESRAMRYRRLLEPGRVSVIDLSDTDAPAVNNLVIADVLYGVQEAQEKAYTEYEQARRALARGAVDASATARKPPSRVLIVIEEAHEFLSAERITKMPFLFQQVARIARRGRKRWLGLVFVTQLPQYLPRQLFGLVNSYVLHKITDPQVVSELRHTISGIDPALWQRLPGLAPGQAIVAFPHLTRPLLVAVDPAPARLRLVD
jgi:DNA helicase HerA-like ATPase